MTDAVYDFENIRRRLNGERPIDEEAPPAEGGERKPWCQAIHPGCDYPDCPCGIP